MSSDEEWMGRALQLADQAALHGDVPVGAVIVGRDGVELGAGENRRELEQDPTGHAEIVALRAAAQRIGHWRVESATLFVTLEPCAMCAGALVNARIERVVFGALDPKAGAVTSLFGIGQDPRLNHRFDVSGGVREAECAERLRTFFKKLRDAGEK